MVALPDEEAVRSAKRQRGDARQDDAMPDAAPVERPSGDDFSSWALHDIMPLYYKRIFPHADFYKWLAYGHDKPRKGQDPSLFKRREFCFTLQNEIFVRYQSFKDGAELAAALASRVPAKIDIGPVYTVDPEKRKTCKEGTFAPVSRELVFDIDITDYDDALCRLHLHGNKTDPDLIMDEGLRQDFGFEHILWVFSGRRGIHGWVCDTRARQLRDDQRAALANYFAVYKGQEEGLAKMFLSGSDHPAVGRSYAILRSAWSQTILPQQALLEHKRHQDKILQYVPCEDTREEVRAAWQKGDADSVARWAALQEICERNSKPRASDKAAVKDLKEKVRVAPERIVLAYTYPRLDIEVSKKMNHLLKAPFCVHPKTGKVCVPIDPMTAAEFDPNDTVTVPTAAGLLNALNADSKPGSKGEVQSLEPAMQTFQKFLKPLQAACQEDMAAEADGRRHSLAW